MKLWSWLFKSLATPSASAPVERGCDGAPPPARETAVAVADLPEDSPKAAPPADSEADAAPWWTPKPDALLDPKDPVLTDPLNPVRALENLLISHFDGHNLTMPTLHNMAERALPRLRGSECNLAAVAADIAEDPVLTAVVLRTVNSPYYRGIDDIASVHRAVTRLGVKAIRTLLMHQSLRGALFGKTGAASRFAQMLWRRSLASACIMRGLAARVRVDEEEAYLLGLLHDIGSIIVLRIVSAEEKSGFGEIDLNTFEYLCRQTHQEFGELVADSWQLPSEVKSLISAHHAYPSADDPLRKQRLMLILTNMIGSVLCFAPPENYDLIHCRAAAELGLSNRVDYTRWLDALPVEIDEIIAES